MTNVFQEITFRDRVQAGRMLGDALSHYAGRQDVLVLGLPRGGVPVAYEVARRLRAPLDVLVVRKLGLPGHEELAMGAVASGGVRVLNDDVVRRFRISPQVLDAAASQQMTEVQRREVMWRGHTGAPRIEGRTVILVDDGIATGATIRAAAQALRMQHPAMIVIAVPVAAPETCAELEQLVDEVIALQQPENFRAVGLWYEDFSATTDDEVARLLAAAARRD